MEAEAIVKYQRQQPFQPFRIRTSADTMHRVTDPAWLLVDRYEVHLSVEPDDTGIPTRTILIDLSHVVEVEPIREKLVTPEEPGDDGGGNGRQAG